MRTALVSNLITLLTILLPTGSACGQEWKVLLDDVYEVDPELDKIRAEAMEFLPDGRTVATAGWFYDGSMKEAVGEVRLRDAKDGSLKAALRGSARAYVNRAGTLAVSPNGKRIAAIGYSGQGNNRQSVLDIFDVAGEKLLRTINPGPSRCLCVTFSPDGKSLAASHHGGVVAIWDHQTGQKTKSFNQPGTWPIAFSPDGNTLAAGGSPVVSFHDVKTGKQIGQIDLSPHLGGMGSLAISPDGKLLAAGGNPVVLCEWTKTNAGKAQAKVKQVFKGHKHFTYSVAFSPDSKLLASANQDETAKIWDLQTGKELKTITAHDDFVYDVAFSPKGDSVVTLGRDALMLWKIKK